VRLALVGASAAVVLFMSAHFLRTEKEIVLSQAADRPIEMAALDEARESADVAVPDRQSREAEPGSDVSGESRSNVANGQVTCADHRPRARGR
jgi:hypothetical protein